MIFDIVVMYKMERFLHIKIIVVVVKKAQSERHWKIDLFIFIMTYVFFPNKVQIEQSTK